MADFFREVVSGSNTRYRVDGYNLDLSYIGDRAIAMGFPATGVESWYRNAATVVRQFLTTRHSSHFKIYNLTERNYSPGSFPEDRIEHYPFPDHHAPSLALLLRILKSMHEWLALDSQNIVVCHCLAGHGRTGTILAALHVYEGDFGSPDESLAFFASKRSSTGKGVKYPSQKRAVHEAYLHLCRCRERNLDPYVLMPPPRKMLSSVEIANIWARPRIARYALFVQDADYALIWNSAWISGKPSVFQKTGNANAAAWEIGVEVQGNFTVKLMEAGKGAREVIRTTQNTDFMAEEGAVVEVPKNDIDGTEQDADNSVFHEKLVMVLRFEENE